MNRLLSFLVVLFTFSIAYAADTTNFKFHSNSFKDNDTMPVDFTCDGKNIAPELDWSNIPDKTQSFALLMIDRDAPSGTFYHWVLYNIPKTVTLLPEGKEEQIPNISEGKNTWGFTTYKGPCPPKGATHHYIFTLYALDKELALPEGLDGPGVLNEIQNHVLKKVDITVTYGH